jgi:translation elongation factor EF-G
VADQIGAITGAISGKRGKLVNIEQRDVLTIVEGKISAAETFDLSEKMRGATAGRAVWNTFFKLWQAVPPTCFPSSWSRSASARVSHQRRRRPQSSSITSRTRVRTPPVSYTLDGKPSARNPYQLPGVNS